MRAASERWAGRVACVGVVSAGLLAGAAGAASADVPLPGLVTYGVGGDGGPGGDGNTVTGADNVVGNGGDGATGAGGSNNVVQGDGNRVGNGGSGGVGVYNPAGSVSLVNLGFGGRGGDGDTGGAGGIGVYNAPGSSSLVNVSIDGGPGAISGGNFLPRALPRVPVL